MFGDELRLVVSERRCPQPNRKEVLVYFLGPHYQGVVEDGPVIDVNKRYSMPNGRSLINYASELPTEGDPLVNGEYIVIVRKEK